MSRPSNHIELSNPDESFQSEFKSSHIDETALLNVIDFSGRASDQSQTFILIILGRLVMFNIIDYNILPQMPHTFVGLSDIPLDLFYFYLSDRTQSVYSGDAHSKLASIRYNIHQGLVLERFSFCIYLLLLSLLL